VLRAIGAAIDRLTFPLNVAAGMEARGLATGAPKALVSPASRKIYGGVVAELRLLFTRVKLRPPAAARPAAAPQ
jgi:4-hydroxy-tetrahydrodipicolinate synthase